jgi:DNA polymerase I-like protein with 3'-5' exonuclease and polymerase domains
MYHIVFKTKKEIVKNIITKFRFHIHMWNSKNFWPASLERETIYLKAFQERLTLMSYGMWPLEAAEAFDELTKLHIGKSVDEIKELTEKLAEYNVRYKRHNSNVPNPLTEEELKAVTEYHKYLFARTTKNENPFELHDY